MHRFLCWLQSMRRQKARNCNLPNPKQSSPSHNKLQLCTTTHQETKKTKTNKRKTLLKVGISLLKKVIPWVSGFFCVLILQCSKIGNHPQDGLARFRYRSEMNESEFFSRILLYFVTSSETIAPTLFQQHVWNASLVLKWPGMGFDAWARWAPKHNTH